jgi:hypothetical protein
MLSSFYSCLRYDCSKLGDVFKVNIVSFYSAVLHNMYFKNDKLVSDVFKVVLCLFIQPFYITCILKLIAYITCILCSKMHAIGVVCFNHIIYQYIFEINRMQYIWTYKSIHAVLQKY